MPIYSLYMILYDGAKAPCTGTCIGFAKANLDLDTATSARSSRVVSSNPKAKHG